LGRSKEKEVVILENYVIELREKIKILSEELRRKENDFKSKTDNSQRTLNELRREIEIFKGDLKNKSSELG